MPIKISSLVENVLTEARFDATTLKQYIVNLLQNNTNYNLALRDAQTNATSKFDELKNYAIGFYRTGIYTTQEDLIENRAFWPIIDFLAMHVFPIFRAKPNEFERALTQKTVAELMKDIPGTEQQGSFYEKLNNLSNPNTYQITSPNINKIRSGPKKLADLRYKNETPMNGILNAIKYIGGFKEKEVIDILKYPRSYDMPGKITKRELEAIQNISEALYFFYTDRIKHPTYLGILKTMIPEFRNSSEQQIEAVIDASVGLPNPQNRALQNDYEQFLNGQSKFLVQLTEEGLKINANDVLNEIMSGAGLATLRQDYQAASQKAPQPQPGKFTNTFTGGKNLGHMSSQQQAQQQTQQTTQQPHAEEPQKTVKPTNTPFIRSIQDFSRPGYNGDQRVQNAFSDFFNFLTRGTEPTAGEKVAKGFDVAGRAVKGLENWLGSFKPF